MNLKRLHNDLHEGALQLIAEHRVPLLARARSLCGNSNDADELVIRTIDQAIRKIDTYTGEGDILSWMMTILVNLHNHDYRSPVVRNTLVVEADELEKCAGADWATDEQILKNSDSEAIRQAISELDPKYNQVLMMRYYEEFSLKQIADILRLPLGTVCRRAQIAHRLLAGKLSGKLGKAKKPLTVAVALLLLGGSLFGAWKAGLGEWLSDFVNPQETQQEQTEGNEEMNAKTIGKVASVAISSMALASAPVRSAAAAEAGGRIVYATPAGAGDMDGRDWANARKIDSAASFVEAYANAADGATVEKPNELWLRYGGYAVAAGNFVLQPNVIVRGGFAGTETSADEADPEANPTLFYNNYFNVNATWLDEAQSKMWELKDGRYFFFDPPVEGDTEMYTKFSEIGDQKVFYREDGADLGTVEFHGVSFSKFWGSAIRAVASCAKPIKLRKCRFLNINWLMHTRNFVIQLTGVGVDMEDCEFVSAVSPVLVKTSSDDAPRLMAEFNRCRFFSTQGGYASRAWGCTSGGIGVLGNVQATIRNCSFDRNIAEVTAVDTLQNGTIVASTTCDLTIEDTVISRGRGFCRTSGGAVGWTPTGDARLMIRRCRFERCCYAGNGGDHVNEGAALTVLGSLANGRVIRGEISDTAFVGNRTAETTTNARGSSCVCFGSNCYGANGWCEFTFLNCLFERNEAIHPVSGAAAGTTVGGSWTQSPRVVFANCVIKDDVCGKIDADGNTVYDTEFGREGNPYFSFVNTVFENSNENVLPWANGKSWFSFAGCVTDNSGAVYGNGSSICYRYAPMVAGVSAGLGFNPLTNGVVVARRLARTSPYHRKGRPLWRGTDREIYLYDAEGDAGKPWRSCRYGGARKTDTEAAELGVSLAIAPLPDAFDAARLAKSALGQLNAIPNGLSVIVK